MATKATTKKKTSRKSTKANARKLPCDIAGLAFIGIGLFAFFSIFTPWAGVVGQAVKAFFFGVFGIVAYALPFLLVAVGWLTLIAWNKKLNAGKVCLSVLAILMLSLFLHLFWHGAIEALVEENSYANYLKACYDYGKESGLGVGLLGGSMTYPIHALIGTAGSFVLSVVALLGCFAGLTKLSLTKVGQKVTETVQKTTRDAAESARTRREERRAEMEARREAARVIRRYEEEEQLEFELHPHEPNPSRAFWDENLKEEQIMDFGQEAAFTPFRRRGEAVEQEGFEDEPIQDTRPPLRSPELDIKSSWRNSSLQQDSEIYEATAAAMAKEARPPQGAQIEKAVPATVRIEDERIRNNPSISDFDEGDDEYRRESVTVTAVPKQELEYVHNEESVPVIDPDAIPPYRFPPMSILSQPKRTQLDSRKEQEEQLENVQLLEETLSSFGIEAKVLHVSRGPAITRYELQPARGVKVSRITGLADDIALNMAAVGVRIEAPIPGKAAVGIEIANSTIDIVPLREVLESKTFIEHPSKLAVALGKDIAGDAMVADLARMPHLLIAGATGSGKSVCINSLIASILYKATPEEVKLILIDPKVVELSVYNEIPHLLIPVVTDPKKAAGALGWAVVEMDERYKKFAKSGVRDLKGYNEYISKQGGEPLPQIVVVIDELADLMMVAPGDVEDRICRLAQLARAAGIHLVIATQRPSVNVITGVIKANIPSRIAFAVASQVDSRTILDVAGAEKLLGRGDMLFDPSGANKALRIQGAFISDNEVNKLVEYVKARHIVRYDPDFMEAIEKADEGAASGGKAGGDGEESVDELLKDAIELAIDSGQVSTSMLQRKFRIGYARAGRLLDEMENRGLISGFEGSKPRQVLVGRDEYQRFLNNQN